MVKRVRALGPYLWGPKVETCPVKQRKWTQYIGVGTELIAKDAACKAMLQPPSGKSKAPPAGGADEAMERALVRDVLFVLQNIVFMLHYIGRSDQRHL